MCIRDRYAGDTVGLSALVLNSGSVDAPETKLLLEVPESSDVLLTTPALTAGSSAWVNTTLVAPSSGVHDVVVTPDAENVVQEASEMNKATDVELVVATRMDLSFKDELTITTAEGALEGPWTVEGTLVRTNGTGPLDVPIWLQLSNPAGGLVTSEPFTVSLTGVGYIEQAFSAQLTSTTLSSMQATPTQGIPSADSRCSEFIGNNVAVCQRFTPRAQITRSLWMMDRPHFLPCCGARHCGLPILMPHLSWIRGLPSLSTFSTLTSR